MNAPAAIKTANAQQTNLAVGGGGIAVLIPVFNAQAKLERTLRSLDSESAAFDIFVVDDGSSPAIVVDATRYGHRVVLVRLDRNRGVAGALNAGLQKILEGDYDFVARHDAGDVDRGERIQHQVDALRADPSLAIVGAWVEFVHPAGGQGFIYRLPSDERGVARRMWYGPSFIHPACMIRVTALRQLGLYSESFPYAEDYELFCRIIRHWNGRNLPEVLVETELNPDGISISRRRAALVSRMRIQWRYLRATSFHALLGLLRSMMLYASPHAVLVRVKTRMKQVG
jgi:glycosyltransferase involved in cell wall biosynthesis